jgi:serine/threonine-protein kinase
MPMSRPHDSSPRWTKAKGPADDERNPEDFSTVRPTSETMGDEEPLARFLESTASQPLVPDEPEGTTPEPGPSQTSPAFPAGDAPSLTAPFVGGQAGTTGETPRGGLTPRLDASTWPTLDSDGNLKNGEVIFGRYRVEERIGVGGWGKVYRVRHLNVGRDRALKLIVPNNSFEVQSLERIKREARSLGKLSEHPNAVAVHDAHYSRDLAYIEMELVRGKSLDKILKAQKGVPLSVETTARILKQVCDLLQFAHDHGIIHRDMKPSNLMLVDGHPPGQEQVKVLDFGIAKNLAMDEQTFDLPTMTNSLMGTPPYTSPEQAEGRAEKRSDIYSVGVIVYEMLTGSRPFKGSIPQLISATLNATPPRFAEINSKASVPEAIEQVVHRCLEKDPRKRPGSARVLWEAFRQALPPEISATATAEAGTPTIIPRSKARRSWAVPVAALAGLAALLALAAVVWLRNGEKPPVNGPGPENGGKPVVPAYVLPAGFVAETAAGEVNGVPRTILHEASQAQFIFIEEGRFPMGAADEVNGRPEELPRHRVLLAGFYIQESEVTFGQMEQFFSGNFEVGRPKLYAQARDELRAALSDEQEAYRHPAVYVSRELAEIFAKSIGARLPTEAEWEFAARSRGKDYLYPWGNDANLAYEPGKLNINRIECEPVCTSAAKSMENDKTEQGVFDLGGNVREWVRDIHAAYPSGDVPNPRGPDPRDSKTDLYVIRGGSYRTPPDHARTTSRLNPEISGFVSEDLGFRVVVPVTLRESQAGVAQ